MKKKIFVLLLLFITSSSINALEMAKFTYPPSFPYSEGKGITSFFKMDYMYISQKMSFKISGTCDIPLKIRATIYLVKDNCYFDPITIPAIIKGKRFHLNSKLLDEPGTYSIQFSAAPKRGGKFASLGSIMLFCGLDPSKAAERRFYMNLGRRDALRSGYSNNYYSIGPIPSTVKNKVRLKITLKKAVKCHFEVIKKEYGNFPRILHFPANFKKGTRTFDYFVKDGPGTYNFKIYILITLPNGRKRLDSDLAFEVRCPNPLPLTTSSTALSSKLIRFIKKNIGKKVGNGSCGELYTTYTRSNNTEILILPMTAERLFKTAPGQKLPLSLLKEFYSGNNVREQYGQTISAKDLRPGDLIEMLDAVWHEKITYGKDHRWSTGGMAHGAVVYKKLGNGKFLIAHQNIGGVKKVRITGFNVKRVKGKEIKYTRLTRGLVPVK